MSTPETPETTPVPGARKYSMGEWGCAALIVVMATFYFIGSCESSSTSSSREVVYNSSWDSSVRQVKDYLRVNLVDPRSVEYIEWSAVSKNPAGGFMVRVKYRSRNSFGGYVLANQIFYMDDLGNVTRYVDVDY